MFDLCLRYSDLGFRQLARKLAGLALLVVLIGLIAALDFSMPEVGHAQVVPIPEYPDASPTARYSWGK